MHAKISIALVAAAALSGCASMGGHSNEAKSQTVTAQERAQEQFQRAADAQKMATQEQQKANEAQQEVARAQKALADAQATARGQQTKAQQSQEEAQRLATQASTQGQQMQETAQTAMQQETKQQSAQVKQRQDWTEAKSITGQVVQASGNQLILRSPEAQQDLSLDVTDSTALRVDGQHASIAQVQPGSDARASYQLVAGKATALRIEVTSTQGQKSINKELNQPQDTGDQKGEQKLDSPALPPANPQ